MRSCCQHFLLSHIFFKIYFFLFDLILNICKVHVNTYDVILRRYGAFESLKSVEIHRVLVTVFLIPYLFYTSFSCSLVIIILLPTAILTFITFH